MPWPLIVGAALVAGSTIFGGISSSKRAKRQWEAQERMRKSINKGRIAQTHYNLYRVEKQYETVEKSLAFMEDEIEEGLYRATRTAEIARSRRAALAASSGATGASTTDVLNDQRTMELRELEWMQTAGKTKIALSREEALLAKADAQNAAFVPLLVQGQRPDTQGMVTASLFQAMGQAGSMMMSYGGGGGGGAGAGAGAGASSLTQQWMNGAGSTYF